MRDFKSHIHQLGQISSTSTYPALFSILYAQSPGYEQAVFMDMLYFYLNTHFSSVDSSFFILLLIIN